MKKERKQKIKQWREIKDEEFKKLIFDEMAVNERTKNN